MNACIKTGLALVVFTLINGCADGANGDKGVVRFSQIVNFVETHDFKPPLVVNRTVMIRLEHANAVGTDGRGFPELSLEVTGGTSQVLPLGFAQYAVRLDEEKDYRFRAKEGAREVDVLTVKAKKGASMRLHANASVVTIAKSGGKTCVKATEVPVAGLTLAPNQEATLFVVPLDASGEPMLGMLQLSAKTGGRSDVQLDTPLFFTGSAPNALMVKPTLTSPIAGDSTLKIEEPAFTTVDQVIAFTEKEATATCQ